MVLDRTTFSSDLREHTHLRSCWSRCRRTVRSWWPATADPGPGAAGPPSGPRPRCSPRGSRWPTPSSEPGSGSPVGPNGTTCGHLATFCPTSKSLILQSHFLSHLDGERCELFLVDGPLVDGVGDGQVDHFAGKRHKSRPINWRVTGRRSENAALWSHP